jgi:hypothetical protein
LDHLSHKIARFALEIMSLVIIQLLMPLDRFESAFGQLHPGPPNRILYQQLQFSGHQWRLPLDLPDDVSAQKAPVTTCSPLGWDLTLVGPAA